MVGLKIPSGTKVDRFIIENSLSESGGMSGVYLAKIENLRQKVAIKIANTDNLGATHEDMLLDWEANLLKQWDWRHAGIVRIFPVPLLGGKTEYVVRAKDLPNNPWYMVMEYLPGDSLAKKLPELYKYPIHWKLELFYKILIPLAFIHQKNFGHRDIKPDNIVFRSSISPDIPPDPVLIDFALCTNGQEKREIIDNSYTLEYASPERLAGLEEDVKASDIWSLGVILYELLTGKLPIKGSKEKIRTTIIRERIEVDKDEFSLPQEQGHILAAFIRAMLKKKPEERPDIRQVIYALEEKFLPPRI